MDDSFDIDPILTKYVREEPLTAQEATALQEWIAGGEGRAEVLERLRNDPEWTKANLIRMQDMPNERVWEKIEARLKGERFWVDGPADAGDGKAAGGSGRAVGAPVVSIDGRSRRELTEDPLPHRPNWFRYAVAASVLVAVAGITYLIRYHHKNGPDVAIGAAPAKPADVQPGGNRATLTLADGQVVNLDSAADGVLTSQGNTYVAKADGKLAYNIAASEKPVAPTYNVLTTPRAGQFVLLLPDGTHVWLNNASSIRYPVWFTGATREVELTGEAYFEVAKDAAHPFRVKIRNSAVGAEGGTVEVLGTSFNVMAYSDERAERATLVSGSIRYENGGARTLLKPEDESVFEVGGEGKPANEGKASGGGKASGDGNVAGELKTLHNVNVEEITAWKDGFFHFDHSDLESTMRQFARWYDITVVYQGKIAPQQFNGKIPRSMSLNTVLKALEGEHVHFTLEGKQVTVRP